MIPPRAFSSIDVIDENLVAMVLLPVLQFKDDAFKNEMHNFLERTFVNIILYTYCRPLDYTHGCCGLTPLLLLRPQDKDWLQESKNNLHWHFFQHNQLTTVETTVRQTSRLISTSDGKPQ